MSLRDRSSPRLTNGVGGQPIVLFGLYLVELGQREAILWCWH
jgi:hypothetical protein